MRVQVQETVDLFAGTAIPQRDGVVLADFDGSTYCSLVDHKRLSTQILRVYSAMRDSHWRTLEEIAGMTGGSVASISARLRDLRKSKFGGFTVNRRARGDRSRGLYEYQVLGSEGPL